MIFISKSPVTCGFCGAELEVEWDLDLVFDYIKSDGGIRSFYESEVDVECPECGNSISAKLSVIEYPEGVLEDSNVIIEKDGSGKCHIELPSIEFFDL